MGISDIFKALEGEWQVSREIVPGGRFEGLAYFTAQASDEYAYHEVGALTLDNQSVLNEVRKKYVYRLEDGRIAVYFDDGVEKGKLFHHLDFNEDGEASAEHLCVADFYKTQYAFDLPSGFRIHHQIKGPKKDYSIDSQFSRLKL